MRLGRYLLLLASILAFGCGGSEEAGQGSDEEFADRMAAEHEGDEPVASGAAGTEPAGPVTTQRVVYGQLEEAELEGYLAHPEGETEGLPAVLVIHEWWGLNENIESMTRRIAGEGYVALAVDLYGGEVAEDRDRARELMMAVSEDPAEKTLRQAAAHLRESYGAGEIGVIGWCFGGGWSLRTAVLLGDELDAAVIYYGRLLDDRDLLAQVEAPILGIFGSEDRGIPVAAVRAFEQTLGELGKAASIHVYEGADHAFANPSGTRYDADAATDAWQKTLAFFAEHLGT